MRKPTGGLKLSWLAEQYELELRGEGETLIEGVGTLSDARPDQISFLSNPAYREQLATTRAGAVIVSKEDAENCPVNVLIANDAYVSYAKIAKHFDPRQRHTASVHATASIDPTAIVANDVYVGANVFIGPACEIMEAASIGPGCVLVAGCKLGESSRLHANVTLCEDVSIGKRTTIHPGAVIGSDGFGLAFDKDHWEKIPQLGSVRIGDDCEIGANTTIDRGAIGDTIIKDDVRLDNLIQIGHNVQIGAHTAMAGKVGISGSTRIGEYCMFAGDTGAVGHIRIADRTTVSARAVITKSILEPGTNWGGLLPAQPIKEWNRSAAHLRKLGKLARRVLNLEIMTGKRPEDD